MKELFKKEIAILSIFKSIRLSDLNIGGALLAIIITIVNLLTKNTIFVPSIGGIVNTVLIVLVLLLFIIAFKKRVEKRDIQAFICIEIVLLFINILLESIFPTSVQFLKVFVSLYVVFNIFVFSLFSITKLTIEEEKTTT